jgi:hypothetical protein
VSPRLPIILSLRGFCTTGTDAALALCPVAASTSCSHRQRQTRKAKPCARTFGRCSSGPIFRSSFENRCRLHNRGSGRWLTEFPSQPWRNLQAQRCHVVGGRRNSFTSKWLYKGTAGVLLYISRAGRRIKRASDEDKAPTSLGGENRGANAEKGESNVTSKPMRRQRAKGISTLCFVS